MDMIDVKSENELVDKDGKRYELDDLVEEFSQDKYKKDGGIQFMYVERDNTPLEIEQDTLPINLNLITAKTTEENLRKDLEILLKNSKLIRIMKSSGFQDFLIKR